MEFEVIDELTEILANMDPNDPEYEGYQSTLKGCQEIQHAIAEGLVIVDENDGEYNFFRADAWHFQELDELLAA